MLESQAPAHNQCSKIRSLTGLTIGEPSKRSAVVAMVVGGLIVAAISAAIGIDGWLMRVFQPEGLPGDFKKTIALFEIFGHGTGVVLIALLVLTLSGKIANDTPIDIGVPWKERPATRNAVEVLISGFLAGLAAICIKPFIVRIRPSKLNEFSHGQLQPDAWIGLRWFDFSPALESESAHGFFLDAIHSFPSGHAATACSLAWVLSKRYPNGRFVFWGCAAMAIVQRLCGQAHYFSDTVVGGVLGVTVALLVSYLLMPVESRLSLPRK